MGRGCRTISTPRHKAPDGKNKRVEKADNPSKNKRTEKKNTPNRKKVTTQKSPQGAYSKHLWRGRSELTQTHPHPPLPPLSLCYEKPTASNGKNSDPYLKKVDSSVSCDSSSRTASSVLIQTSFVSTKGEQNAARAFHSHTSHKFPGTLVEGIFLFAARAPHDQKK